MTAEAFCQREDQKISNEHIWPNWARKYLPVHENLTVEMHRIGRNASRWSPKDSAGVTINDVCKLCNEGWMHTLEGAVEPFLSHMISGDRPVELSPDQATTFAAWTYKITLLFDLIGPRDHRRFETAAYQAFYESRRARLTSVTWFAAFIGSMLSTATDRGLAIKAGGGEVVAATFSIGRLAFQLLSYDPRALPRPGVWIPHLPLELAARVGLLWPILAAPDQACGSSWPPA